MIWENGRREGISRGRHPWSFGGSRGPQPDGQGSEDCLAILNNVYNDGVKFHDVGCSHRKPTVCEQWNVQTGINYMTILLHGNRFRFWNLPVALPEFYVNEKILFENFVGPIKLIIYKEHLHNYRIACKDMQWKYTFKHLLPVFSTFRRVRS